MSLAGLRIALEVLVRSAAEDPEVQRAAWELVLVIAGAVSTTAAGAAVLWKIARPHVERYVRSVVTPVRDEVRQVRDEVHNAPTSDPSVDRKLDHLAAAVRRNTVNLERVAERTDLHHELLQQHVEESRGYLVRAAEALEAQGIYLPGEE